MNRTSRVIRFSIAACAVDTSDSSDFSGCVNKSVHGLLATHDEPGSIAVLIVKIGLNLDSLTESAATERPHGSLVIGDLLFEIELLLGFAKDVLPSLSFTALSHGSGSLINQAIVLVEFDFDLLSTMRGAFIVLDVVGIMVLANEWVALGPEGL